MPNSAQTSSNQGGGFVAMNDFTTGITGSTAGTISSDQWMRVATQFVGDSGARVVQTRSEDGKISAKLYFSYIKSKFNIIDRVRIDRRMKVMEKAFNKAVDAGQDMLAEKTLNQISVFMRETMLLTKGIKYQISKDEVSKYKRRIKGGHISDTALAKFTRVIPENVVKRLNEVKHLFDSFVIYHYWSEAAQEENVKDMSSTERANMRDPVLFGQFKEDPDKLYFIADWEDEYCDLTFDEMLEAMGKGMGDSFIPNDLALAVSVT